VDRLVDGVLALAWLASVLAAWGRPGRRPLWALAAGLVLAGLVATIGVRLERETGGRYCAGVLQTALGLSLVLVGTGLHARARAALGPAWAPIATPGAELVTRGPYAHLRHPAYAGLALMAIGSVLAHPSVAVGAAALGLVAGLVLKARVEDRRLAGRFGDRWRRWAAGVPAWSPPLRWRGRPR
jgi:protein-S-isoprenylcysteine O-methyltransferase Ste14